MKKETLFCGFKGNDNTSKLLLDSLKTNNKLYLENNFNISVKQLLNKIGQSNYDCIIMFGQKPVLKSICLETLAKCQNVLFSTYNIAELKCHFDNLGYKVKTSENPGNYLCNNVYYQCLKYVDDNNLKTKVIFIRIPTVNNIFNIQRFANDIQNL
jgi:pyrrolidone-carboxylate peptidase